jgi:hypothetical protein
LRPVFFISAAALFLTMVLWPVTAITRRQFGARLALNAPALRAYRLSKIGATAIVAATAAWVVLFSMMLTRNTLLNGGTDGVLRLIELLGIVAFIGGFVCMLMNLRAVWTGVRRWPAKVWSVVLTLSAFFMLWIAFVFNLLSLGANY